MSVGFSCKCPERAKPVEQRNWVVTTYKWNYGRFVKAGGEPSDYSEVRCLSCSRIGRTKAKYVEKLSHMDWEEAYRIGYENLKASNNVRAENA